MTTEELNILIHKQLTGQASPVEQEQFDAWLSSDEANPTYFQKMAEIWAAAQNLDLTVQAETEAEWEKLRKKALAQQPNEKPSAKIVAMRRVRWLAAAAAVVLGVALWWLLGRGDAGVSAPLHFAANGKAATFALPDGTSVVLNTGSSLTALQGYGGSSRKVTLTGEAYFQVKPDSRRPFLVDAEGATVRVVGTSFQVRAYPNGQSVTAAVAEGRVEFFTHEKNKVLLTPGMEGVFEKNTEKITTRPVTIANIAAWRDGKLVLDNLPLVEALDIIGRHYGLPVKIEGDIAGKQLFSAFDNEPLDDVLKTLELTYDLVFEVKNDTLLVRGK